MNKRRRGCWLAVFSLFSIKMYSVPAYPHKILYKFGDSTEVSIRLKGDEYNKWALTTDNYTLLPSGNEWYFAKADSMGNAVRSGYKLCADAERPESLRRFLAQQPKGLRPMVDEAQKKRLSYRNRAVEKRGRHAAVVGERRALVILMSFADVSFTKTEADFDALFNEPGYAVDGAQGSVYDYFREVSYGQLSFHCDVLGPYRAVYPMAYYGSNGYGGSDVNPYVLFLEAMEHAVREIDLQDYDADGDGYVDNVHIVFAGYGEEAGASPSAIWSHEAMFPEITMQGMKIDRYSCTPELRGNRGGGISRIGPCCHEMGHALGAMDYYDTDYTTGGSFEGTGVWDVMAQGSWNNDGIIPAHFNPYVKAYDFGWVGVTTLTHTGDYSLHPSTWEKDGVYRVDTGSEGDFYLLESRVRDGFDTALPGEGLMVYHVHPRIEEGAYGNTINASAPQMMYPVCASSSVSVPSSSSYSYGEINSAGCPFPGSSGKTEFGGQTVPAAFAWDGSDVGFELSDINRTADGQVSFRFTVDGTVSSSEWKTEWNESFENPSSASSWLVSSQWGYTTEWERMVADGSGGIGEIVSWDYITDAADGSYYMGLVQRFMLGSLGGVMVSPPVTDNPGGNAKLRFFYQNKARSGGQVTLEVYCKKETSKEWIPLQVLDAITGTWTKQEVDLPVSTERLQVIFLAKTEGACGAFVDDVSILKPKKGDALEVASKPAGCQIGAREGCLWVSLSVPSVLSVYAWDGHRILSGRYEAGEQTFRLPSGIYVVRIGEYVQKVRIHN